MSQFCYQSAIVEKQDASSIPFPMTFMGAVVSFLWLLYGIILLNYFMVVRILKKSRKILMNYTLFIGAKFYWFYPLHNSTSSML